MQISFEAETPRAGAATKRPTEIIVFQHAGGERASWGDSKVQKEGTHPIVYPAAGSHATFYDSAVYVQNGQHGSGLGCDNTSGPLRELRPPPVMLPDEVAFERARSSGSATKAAGANAKRATTTARPGRRRRRSGANRSPGWPTQRTTSPRLPGGSIVGPQVTGAFCGAVAPVSELINLDVRIAAAGDRHVIASAILIALFVGLTRWGPIDLNRLRPRRAFGQIVRTARQLYGRHWRLLVPIALTAIPIVGGTNLLAGLFASGSGVDDATGALGLNLALGDLIESIGRPVAYGGRRRDRRRLRPRRWSNAAGRLPRRLARPAAPLLARRRRPGARHPGDRGVAITIIGLPFAIWKLVGWSFVEQEVLFTDKTMRESFHGSSDLVRGRWWHTVRVVVFLFA